MNTISEISQILIPLEVFLILITLLITIEENIFNIIGLYRFQTLLVLVVVLLTAVDKLLRGTGGISFATSTFLFLICLLPLALYLFISNLLKSATLSRKWELGKNIRDFRKNRKQRGLIQGLATLITQFKLTQEDNEQIQRIWGYQIGEFTPSQNKSDKGSMTHPNKKKPTNIPRDLLNFILLMLLSFVMGFYVFGTGASGGDMRAEQIGLAVSLCLHLTGLYNAVIKRTIISQVIGVLIMDHGLYLAVVKIVAVPVPAQYFVIALYAYTIITIVILVLMIPQVIRTIKEEKENDKKTPVPPSIDLDDIANSSPLAER